MRKEENIKKEKGITLIALVVTVVILLILAATSFGMLGGENGIIKKAQESKEETTIGEETEQVEMAYVSAALNKLNEKVTSSDLQRELNIILNDDTKTIVSDNGDDTLNVLFNDTKHKYAVNNGKVAKVNAIDFDTILADVSENYNEYLLKAQEKGQTTETNIGIGTDGKVVNLDLWHYYKTDDGEGVSIGSTDDSTRVNGYDNENVVEGKIQGRVPQYIYILGENKSYPVVSMLVTFQSCTSLIQAPEIPSSVTRMDYVFANCTSLTQAPVIPGGVINMEGTFKGCISLTGTVTINANPTGYTDCFAGTTKPITLTGTSTMLSALAGTAENGNVTY